MLMIRESSQLRQDERERRNRAVEQSGSSERMESSFRGVSTSQRQANLAPGSMSYIESRHISDLLAQHIYEIMPKALLPQWWR
jgi:hypothetical protein